MTILKKAQKLFIQVLMKKNISLDEHIAAEPLGVEEALGDPSPYKDFALQRGVEKLVEVKYREARGQAFTSCPLRWKGTLGEVLDLPLESDRERALLVASMNAVGRCLDLADKTVHCKDDGPERCGKKMAAELVEKYGMDQVIGIVGYQPALLKNIVSRFGPEKVRTADLNPENIGKVACGVPIWDGEKDLDRIAEECSLCMATGSSLSNNTLDRILEAFCRKDKKVIFYGTTIAFPAVLLGLDRLCFESK